MIDLIKRAWHGLCEITLRDFWWFEFLSALALLTWAIVAITAPNRLSTRHFGPLLHFASESTLEYLVLTVATMQFFSVTFFMQWVRVASDFAASLLVGALFLAILLAGSHPQPGVGYYGVAWVGNVIAAIKLTRKRGPN